MAKFLKDQLEFLEYHGIPLSQVFDATGMSTNDYRRVMDELGMVVAIGVTPCAAAGHTLRTRGGHCAQCKPANLAFVSRWDNAGDVYVATSESICLTKLGTAQNAYVRADSLNFYAYGGSSDWEIRFTRYCETAGRVEFLAQQALKRHNVIREYIKQGSLITCQELFDCDTSLAISAIDTAIEKLGQEK